MGIKITELTSAGKLVGNELTPFVQSTETRQAAVSSVFTALTSQNDGRYVCGITCSSQGYLAYTGAGNCSSLDLGLNECSNVCFAEVTACGDLTVNSGSLIVPGTGSNYICTSAPLSAFSGVDICSNLNVRGHTILGDSICDTLTITGNSEFCSTLTAKDNLTVSGNISATANVDASDIVVAECIHHKNDSTTFIEFRNGYMDLQAGNVTSGIQIGPGYVVINEDEASDMDFCLRSSCGTALYADGGNGYVGLNCTAPTEQLAVCGSQTISGSLTATNIKSQVNLTLPGLPTSDPLIAGGVWYCPGENILRISCVT